jgi:hypothetical protein
MLDPSGCELGCDVHRGYKCFDNGNCTSQGGGLLTGLLLARKLNPTERGNTSYAYDLKALAVCEAVKHLRCYFEGCSEFLVVTNHDTLRHLLKQPNIMLNKRQAR